MVRSNSVKYRPHAILGNARGVSLLEFTIVLPVIIFIFMLTIDIGRVFGQYLAIQGLVNSGIRSAQGLPNLEVAANLQSQILEPSGGPCQISYVGAWDATFPAHRTVHNRVANAICSLKQLNALAITNIQTTSSYAGFVLGSPTSQTVRVRVSGTLELINGPILPWSSIPVASEAIAPYLS